jgi:hypothetical protein
MLNLGFDCEASFVDTLEVRSVKECDRPRKLAPIRVGLLGGFMGCIEK